MSTIGEYIKAARTALGISQAELARRAGISKGYLSTLERGQSDPSLAILQVIAKAFDMGAGDLLVLAGYTIHRQEPTLYCFDTKSGRIWPVVSPSPDADEA